MLTRKEYINRPVEIEFELLHLFKQSDPLVIFDVGACEAEDSIRYSNLFPKSTVYAFEPRIDNCKKANELIGSYQKKNILLENLALSNKKGTAIFYLSDGEPGGLKNDENWNYGNKSSSLLPPSEEMKKYTSWLSFEKQIEVETKRLDEYAREKNISSIDFMHIDVQGAELMVFEGAGSFMNNIKVIWTEVEAVKLYKDQPITGDVEKFMTSHNFMNILDTVNEVSGDQLYVNMSHFKKEIIDELIIKKKKSQSKLSGLKSFFRLNKTGK